jgi:hypothetical protein
MPHHLPPRRLQLSSNRTAPATIASPPYTAHRIWPVIKLPGNTLIPWRNHTPPDSTNSAPKMFNVIRMFDSERELAP